VHPTKLAAAPYAPSREAGQNAAVAQPPARPQGPAPPRSDQGNGLAGAKNRHKLETAASASLPKKTKKESERTTPLDVLGSDGQLKSVGGVTAVSCVSYSELWTAVAAVCGDRLNRASARLVYQDREGDWLVLLPELPFTLFSSTVQRLMLIPNK